jgi:phospho-N-acetylmuramoyl-pentapeptide-transferase
MLTIFEIYQSPFFWYGLVLSCVLAFPIFKLLLRMNSIQKVSEFAPATHQAKQGTPTMGGLIFAIPVILLSPLLMWFGYDTVTDNSDRYTQSALNPQIALITLFALFAGIGFVDDYVVPKLMVGKRGLGWKQKLGMQFVVALCYSLVLKHTGWQCAVDVMVILAVANAYNFADGLDGLASSIGLLLIPGLIFLNVAVRRYEFTDCLLMVSGAMLPFAFLNAPKAKVFMGDVGSLAFGALAGASFAIPIDSQPNLQTLIAAKLLALVLLAELLPVPLQIFWVKVFKKRLFPFTPIHHAFEKAGWPETRVVAMFALIQLVCTVGCVDLLLKFGSGWNKG